jgi:hypothetical protein
LPKHHRRATSREFIYRSPKKGRDAIGTPPDIPSTTDPQPECVTNAPTDGCRSTGACGAHDTRSRPEFPAPPPSNRRPWRPNCLRCPRRLLRLHHSSQRTRPPRPRSPVPRSLPQHPSLGVPERWA